MIYKRRIKNKQKLKPVQNNTVTKKMNTKDTPVL